MNQKYLRLEREYTLPHNRQNLALRFGRTTHFDYFPIIHILCTTGPMKEQFFCDTRPLMYGP